MEAKKYLINEIFYSLQGEGYYAGTPAVFIRFAGCNLSCPFCDTDFKHGNKMTAEQIIAKIAEIQKPYKVLPPHDLVVLTGGEPTLQADKPLYEELKKYFSVVAMETNGTGRLAWADFLTVSPKDDYVPKAHCSTFRANEVKVVFDGKHDPSRWELSIFAEHYYLQPCDTGDAETNAEIMAATVEYILSHPQWKLSLQTQKILKIR